MIRTRSARCPDAVAGAVLILGLFAAGSGIAQLPEAKLLSVFPPGGARGTTVEVTLRGEELDPADALVFSHPGIRAEPIVDDSNPFLGRRPEPGRWRVEIAGDVPPGRYDVRVEGRFGVSNPRTFVVGSRAERAETDGNDERSSASAIRAGEIGNGRSERRPDLDWWRIEGEPQERLVIRCDTRVIDSPMEALIAFFDADGREVTRSRESYHRSAELDVSLSSEGIGFVLVRDAIYDGGEHHVYRLDVSRGPVVDAVLPPCGEAGKELRATVFGRALPGGTPAPDRVLGERPLERLEVTIAVPAVPPPPTDSLPRGLDRPEQVGLLAFPWWLTASDAVAEPVWIGIASAPVTIEKEPNDDRASATALEVPGELAGTFYPRGDVDWVSFHADPGEPIILEIFAHRLGSPVDPYLLVERANGTDPGPGQELRRIDDAAPIADEPRFHARTDDARFELGVSESGEYRVAIRDLNGELRADPRSVYRLSVTRAEPRGRIVAVRADPGVEEDPRKNRPQIAGSLLRRGGSEAIDVLLLDRGGFDVPVTVRVEGLPPSVSASPLVLRPGEERGRIVLSATKDAASWVGPLSLVAEYERAGETVRAPVETAALTWPAIENRVGERSRRADGIRLSVRAEELAPVTASSPSAIEMSRAGKVKLAITVERRESVKGKLDVRIEDAPGVSAKPVSLEPDQSAAEFEIAISEKAPIGSLALQWVVRGQASDSRAPEIVESLTEKKKTVAAELARIQTELEALTKDLAAAKSLDEGSLAAVAARDEKVDEALEAVVSLTQIKDGTATVETARSAARSLVAEVEARTRAKLESENLHASHEALTRAFEEKERDRALAQSAVETLAKDIERATERAKPRDVRFASYGVPVSLVITPAPIEITSAPEALEIAQGGRAELALAWNRKYGFDGPVKLRLEVPQGSAPIAAEPIEAGGDASAIAIAVDASRVEAPGEVAAVLHASLRFGDKDLEVSRPVRIRIVGAEKAEDATAEKKAEGS